MSIKEDKRGLGIVALAVVTVALAGFVTGTQAPDRVPRPQVELESGQGAPARSYRELRAGRRGPNAEMYQGAFARLRAAGPALLDPVEQTPEEHDAALEQRRLRRAYAGAPPTIPHAIDQRADASCLACHRTGSRLAGLRAPMLSHEPYAMCVQCHAPGVPDPEMVAELSPVGEHNVFVGTVEPGHGDVAWAGAPPLIPHPTFMRQACNSCHGPQGAQGMKTPHPVRASCTQCHAPSAPFDQNAPPPLRP